MNNQNDHQGHNHSKHMLWMAVCCLAPLLIVFLVPGSGIAKMLSPLLFLICPISMLLMSVGMMKSSGKKD